MAIPVEARVAERLTTRTGDLEVRGSRPAPRRAVSLDNELYSTFFLFLPRCTNGYRQDPWDPESPSVVLIWNKLKNHVTRIVHGFGANYN